MASRALVGLLVALIGCSASGLDELQDRAGGDGDGDGDGDGGEGLQPDPGDGVLSSRFPTALAYAQGDDATAMRFVAAGEDPPILSTFEYGYDATLRGASLNISEFVPGPASFSVAAAGGDTGGEDGIVAVGFGDRIEVFEVGDAETGPQHLHTLDSSICPDGPYPNIGENFILAKTDAATTTELDIVASSGDKILLFYDVAAEGPNSCAVCTLPFAGTANGFAAVELGGVGHESEIMGLFEVLDGPTGDDARIVVFRGQQIRGSNAGTCFGTFGQHFTRDVTGAELGRPMVVGDFAGDENDDVALGNASTGEVSVFVDWQRNLDAAFVSVTPTETGVHFGARLDTADLDGDGRAELIVADPEATRDGKRGAGVVHVFDFGSGAPLEQTPLEARSPGEDESFGSMFAIGEFALPSGNGDAQPIAIVGSLTSFATMFGYESAVDPRR